MTQKKTHETPVHPAKSEAEPAPNQPKAEEQTELLPKRMLSSTVESDLSDEDYKRLKVSV